MDHAISAMLPHYEVLLDWYIDEQKTGDYKRYNDNPHQRELKALNNAMNILSLYLGWEPNKLVREIRYRLEAYKK